MRKKACMLAVMLSMTGIMSGCAASSDTADTVAQTSIAESGEESTTAEETTIGETTTEEPTTEETTTEEPTTEEPTESFLQTGKQILFSEGSGFYTDSFTLKLQLQGEGKVYYTLDNTTPSDKSILYEDGINLMSGSDKYPGSVCVRAIGYLEDGTTTDEIAQTYMLDKDIFKRFSTDVFCLSGEPEELTGKNGILNKPKDRGPESERRVFITAFTKDGQVMFEQFAGVRVYGGASRGNPLKSLKLFARKEYDAENGKFKYNIFDTEDYKDEYVDKYSKLVLRNTGNDMQFAYIRDEYAQTLAKKAGYQYIEGVIPTVGYMNGEYYCLYWLHENFCDTYFKQKFGKADGEFIVLEGTDTEKSTDDEEEKPFYEEYQALYDLYSEANLTDDKIYEELTKVIDVENYLDYFAFNIYLSNCDWPNNNFKCFRYYPVEADKQTEGVFDGRWRYLLHDMDYSMGLYEQYETKANHNKLKAVMEVGNIRYSPLFTKLMGRQDCKEYFVNKTIELMNGALSIEGMLSTLDEVDALRDSEMDLFYKYLDNLRNKGNGDVWTRADHLNKYMKLITDFITARPGYMVKHIQSELGVTIEENEAGEYVVTGN